MTTIRIFLGMTVVLLLAGRAAAGDPEIVTFTTADRLKISGEFWPAGRKGAPSIVALHGVEENGGQWKEFAHLFWKKGIDFLAIDQRGFGDSRKQKGKDLSVKVKERDERHFRSMWKDAVAARDFLVQRGGDPGRVAFLGAGMGASVALDAASHEPRILGAALLTPEMVQPGFETEKHLKGWGERPLLILSTKGDAKKGAKAIAKTIGKSAVLAFEDRDAKVKSRLAEWLPDLLGAGLYLDGEVTKSEEPRVLFGDWDMMENGKGRPALHAAGRWLYAAVRLEGGTQAPERFYFAWARDGDEAKARRIACEFGKKGSKFTYEELAGGRWKVVKGVFPQDVRLGVSSLRAVEVLIPRHLEGLTGEGALNVAFGLALKKGNHLSALPLGDNSLNQVKKWLDYYLPE